MKNRRAFIIAVISVTVLTACSAVFAAGAASPASVQSGAEATAVQAAQKVFPHYTTDISRLEFAPGSKAEEIITQVAACRRLTQSDINTYNSYPDDIKQLTYEEAGELCAQIERQLSQMNYSDPGYYELSQQFGRYYSYMEIIATGDRYIADRIKLMDGLIKDKRYAWNIALEMDPDYTEAKMHLQANELCAEILEKIKEEAAQPDRDTDKLIYELNGLYGLRSVMNGWVCKDDPYEHTDRIREKMKKCGDISELLGDYVGCGMR